MTWFGLVRKNLLRRPVRTLLTAAGVALGVGLIVALLSIAAGTKRTAGDLIHFGRADFGLFQSGVSDATKSLLPVSLEQRIAHAGTVHIGCDGRMRVTASRRHGVRATRQDPE